MSRTNMCSATLHTQHTRHPHVPQRRMQLDHPQPLLIPLTLPSRLLSFSNSPPTPLFLTNPNYSISFVCFCYFAALAPALLALLPALLFALLSALLFASLPALLASLSRCHANSCISASMTRRQLRIRHHPKKQQKRVTRVMVRIIVCV